MAESTGEGPGRRYQWEQVRETFVEGYMDGDGILRFPNLRETAELHEVPYNRTREHAAREGWNEGRAAFQAQMEHARFAEKSQTAAREMQQIDSQALIAAKTGMTLSLARLRELAKEVNDRAQAGQNGDGLSVYLEPLDVRELGALAHNVKAWRELAALSLGVPSEVTAVEISGPGGTPVDLRQELMFDDPDDSRLTRLFIAMERANLLPEPGGEGGAAALGPAEDS